MPDEIMTRKGACHRGAICFEVTLEDGYRTILRYDRSVRMRRGAVVVVAAAGGVRMLQGEDALASYRFNTGVAQHFFCSYCGIYTHHQRRSDPARLRVNVACLVGVSPADFAEVSITDGVNHPDETGGPARHVGTLRFVPGSHAARR